MNDFAFAILMTWNLALSVAVGVSFTGLDTKIHAQKSEIEKLQGLVALGKLGDIKKSSDLVPEGKPLADKYKRSTLEDKKPAKKKCDEYYDDCLFD